MQLRIENIGPISSANIELTGLTVIGGLNNSGKSTVGKVLFSVVKSIRNREEEVISNKKLRISPLIVDFISSIRSLVGSAASAAPLFSILRRLQDVERFSGEDSLHKFDIASAAAKEEILENLNDRIKFTSRTSRRAQLHINLLEDATFNEDSRKELLDNTLNKIREVVAEKEDSINTFASSFRSITTAIFKGRINNRKASKAGTIKISDDGQDIFSAIFPKNKLDDKKFKINNDYITSLFEDVTLLESPFVLNFEEIVLKPRLADGNYSGDYATYDLIDKLSIVSQDSEPVSLLERQIVEKVSNIIGGKIYYDTDSGHYAFLTLDDYSINIVNTASGIKALGIIQMLALSGALNTSNLLIIDEPEVHLHPAWQIVYAEVVALLVKNNVYCVVSSHSPYFIQALEAYAKIYEIDKLTKFYVSLENENGSCNFSDVTEDTEPLYKLLADPMKHIAFLRTKAENE